ncbi:MAG: branched-chain amino acid ABC transporter permease [Aeromicrobium sp.]
MRLLLRSLLRPSLWVVVVVIVLLGSWPYVTASPLDRETFFLLFMFVTLASSLNILLGYTGYVNFGNVVFFGLGGYIGFYLIKEGWHLVPASLVAGAAVTLFALAIGGPVLRLRGAYFALVTIGVNEAVRALVTNLDFLGASTGMSLNFSVYDAYGGASDAQWFSYGYALLITVLVVVLSFLVKNAKVGLGLQSIREDEDAAEVLGIDTPRSKLFAYALSAFFPAVVGTIFFFKNANIEPAEAFQLRTSIETIVMVMLGGAGTVWGAVGGAAVYEQLRSSLLTAPGVLRELHLFFSGAILLVIILFIPEGVIGYVRRKSKKARAILE